MLLERNLYCVLTLRDCISPCNRNVLLLALKLFFLKYRILQLGRKEMLNKITSPYSFFVSHLILYIELHAYSLDFLKKVLYKMLFRVRASVNEMFPHA